MSKFYDRLKIESNNQVVDEWMAVALQEARIAANNDEVPIGAVVVFKDKLIAKGRNRKESLHCAIGHAEIDAIVQASQALNTWRLTGCALVTTLEPCPMCLAACQQARIDLLIYGAADKKGGSLSLGYGLHDDKNLNHRFEIYFRETQASSELLKEFFRKKR